MSTCRYLLTVNFVLVCMLLYHVVKLANISASLKMPLTCLCTGLAGIATGRLVVDYQRRRRISKETR